MFLGERIARGVCGSLVGVSACFDGIFLSSGADSPSMFLISSSELKIAIKLCCSLLLTVSHRFTCDSPGI